MRELITSYTFTASTKTITFIGLTFEIERLVLIVNQTKDVIIFANGVTGLGYSSYTSSTVVLDFDTTTHSDSDKLHIVYESDSRLGSLTETAPATDTASSGLNGRLQRIAQRLTTLIGLLPTALGQTTKSASLAVTLPSDIDTIPVSLRANTAGTGGRSVYCLIAAASNNAANIKSEAGNVQSITAFGLTASVRYLKLYNKASSPTPASDSGNLLATFPVPANTAGAGFTANFGDGINFSTGISVALVAGIGTSDNTSVAANDCVVIITYS